MQPLLELKTRLGFCPVKVRLHHGKNHAKPVGSKEQKKYFAILKNPNLALFCHNVNIALKLIYTMVKIKIS
jgi:hypothetical protein